MKKWAKGLMWTGAAIAGSAAAYRLLVRPWHQRWGANDRDVARRMPGDDLVENPDVVTNHAINIGVAPEAVWPWLVQMGEAKGGFYSYDWFEELLGMQVESTDSIEEDLQHVTEGEALTRDNMLEVAEIFREQALVVRVPDKFPKVKMSWAFGLYPLGDQATRLVVRMRYRNDADKKVGKALYDNFVLDLGHFVMERKMLQGIKKRAEREHERLVQERRRPPAARTYGPRPDGPNLA